MFKKIIYFGRLMTWTVIILSSFVLFVQAVTAISSEKVLVEVLERNDCVHCQAEKKFLENEKEKLNIRVVFYDIATDEGKKFFDQVTDKANLSKATPITIIGQDILQGFDSVETTGEQMKKIIDKQDVREIGGFEWFLKSGINNNIQSSSDICSVDGEICQKPNQSFLVKIPFFGVRDVSEYSLPVMAGILGFIDGFNPCAMWVLVTFLLVLMQVGSKSRMWIIAGLFIMAETIMYYLILNIWFTTWDFVGLDRIITPIVGLLAFGGGLFFLYEWWKSDGSCLVTNIEGRAKISNQIKKLATEPFTLVTALGVVGLAFSVNIIEFACSIGIPQAFTKIIEINQLSFLQTQGMMLDYILFYMLDDFIVFGLVLWGVDKLHSTAKYSKWCNLIGGILMLILGYLLIFIPETLKFIE